MRCLTSEKIARTAEAPGVDGVMAAAGEEGGRPAVDFDGSSRKRLAGGLAGEGLAEGEGEEEEEVAGINGLSGVRLTGVAWWCCLCVHFRA